MKCAKCRKEIQSDPVLFKGKKYLQWVVLGDGRAYCLQCAAENSGLDVGELLSTKGIEINVELAHSYVAGIKEPLIEKQGQVESMGEPFPLGRGLRAVDGITIFKGKIGRWFYWLAVVVVQYEGNKKRSIRIYRWRRKSEAEKWRVDNKLNINSMERFVEIVEAVKRLSPLLGGAGGPVEDGADEEGGGSVGGGTGDYLGDRRAQARGRSIDALIEDFLERDRGRDG